MPDSLSRMEDASLYVLDLLEPEAKRAFEAELAASEELRLHVADLRTNLDALALAVPPALPPARVWQAIAERTAPGSRTEESSGTSAWVWLRAWFTNGWAVATLIASVFVLHLLLEPARLAPKQVSSVTPDSRPTRSNGPAARSATVGTGAGASAERSVRGTNASREPGGAVDPRLAGEAARLQERVRDLSRQVEWLTRELAQPVVLPAGAARLQVFRLVATNGVGSTVTAVSDGAAAEAPRFAAVGGSGSGSGSGTGTTGNAGSGTGATTGTSATTTASAVGSGQDLSLTLALAAARQFAAVSTAPTVSNPGAATVIDGRTDGATVAEPGAVSLVNRASLVGPSGADVSVPTTETSLPADSIRVVDLGATGMVSPGAGVTASGGAADGGVVSGVDGTAFGAFSPETGLGAIAFRVPGETAEPGVYQLWVSDAQTGAVSSLGYTATGGAGGSGVLVLKFAIDANVVGSPSFLITREPVGGSILPTGPVVAVPPPLTGLAPVP